MLRLMNSIMNVIEIMFSELIIVRLSVVVMMRLMNSVMSIELIICFECSVSYRIMSMVSSVSMLLSVVLFLIDVNLLLVSGCLLVRCMVVL